MVMSQSQCQAWIGKMPVPYCAELPFATRRAPVRIANCPIHRKAERGHSSLPARIPQSLSFAAGDGFFGRHGSRSVDSKPSRRAVRLTQASSGEWPAAPDARPESLDLFLGHPGIDLLDPSGRPGEEAIGPVAHASRPRRRRRRDSTTASLPHAPPSWPVMCQWLFIRQYARMRILTRCLPPSRIVTNAAIAAIHHVINDIPRR
jgi:hypothetical protein